MLKHVWRNRYIDHELFARQGRLLRNPIAEINIIGKIFPGVEIGACWNTFDVIDILTASCLLVKAVYCAIRSPKSILLVKSFRGVEMLENSGVVWIINEERQFSPLQGTFK